MFILASKVLVIISPILHMYKLLTADECFLLVLLFQHVMLIFPVCNESYAEQND